MPYLSEVAEIQGGWTSAAADRGDIRLVRTTDLSGGRVDWGTVPYSSTAPEDLDRYLLRDLDVLVARSGVGSVGNVAIVESPPEATHASYLFRLRAKPPIQSRFLYWFLRSPLGRARLLERAVGAVMPNLSKGRLEGLEVPCPELSEQSAVTERLELANADVEEVGDSLERAKLLLLDLRAGAWLSSVSRAQVDLESAPRMQFGDLVTFEDGARRPLNATERAARPGAVPYFGASGQIDTVEGQTHEGERLLVSEDGSNLRSRRTPIASIVRGAFWANNHTHVLSVQPDVDIEYLCHYLNWVDVEDLLTGTVQPKLNKSRLQTLRIPLPTMKAQKAIAAEAERMGTHLSELEDGIATLAARVQDVWSTALEREFGVPSAPIEREPKPSSSPRRKRDSTVYDGVIEALTKGGAMSPEDLFQAMSWAVVGAPEEAVDRFYEEIRSAFGSGLILEERSGDSVTLRLSQ